MKNYTGNAVTKSLALILKDNVPVNAPLVFLKAQKLMKVERLSKTMTEIHAQVAEKATRDRKAAFQRHNKRRMCVCQNSKWTTTCLAQNTARAVRPASCEVEGPAQHCE
jgi:hypothetical protein